MTDDELIEELFNRALKSEVFCVRVINACSNFIKDLDKTEE